MTFLNFQNLFPFWKSQNKFFHRFQIKISKSSYPNYSADIEISIIKILNFIPNEIHYSWMNLICRHQLITSVESRSSSQSDLCVAVWHKIFSLFCTQFWGSNLLLFICQSKSLSFIILCGLSYPHVTCEEIKEVRIHILCVIYEDSRKLGLRGLFSWQQLYQTGNICKWYSCVLKFLLGGFQLCIESDSLT